MIGFFSLCVMVVAIYVLAVVTDEFFVPSLDAISHRWRLSENVAGASLMAVGSSAPELSIALLALFRDGGAHSDVGIGTIVGSAVFNILVITGVAAVVREARIALMAVVRDTTFYMASILLLFLTLWDGRVTLFESIMFLVWYAIYLVFLIKVPALDVPPETASDKAPAGDAPAAADSAGHAAAGPGSAGPGATVSDSATNAAAGPGAAGAAAAPAPGFLRRANRLLVAGIGWLAGESMPRAFVVSIVFIIGLSWILVDSALIFAGAIGLPPVIIALTILAGGTSAPDLIASVVVARQGRGGMAVANAVGSNIFDILICLGLPWTLALLITDRGFVPVATEDLILSTAILVATVVLLFVFLYTDRRLTRREGWVLLGAYLVYVALTIMGA